jgi:hypothetical protein
MDDNPYTDLFAEGSFELVDHEAAMPNKARGDDPDLPARVREVVDEVAGMEGREASEYVVWHNATQILVFLPDDPSNALPGPGIELDGWSKGPYQPAEPVHRDIPPVMSEPMLDVYMPVTGVRPLGWCAPTEAERWQWMSDDERAAEIAEARAAADRGGYDYIVVGGMTMPHPPPSFDGFGALIPLPIATDGLMDLPAVRISVDTEEFRARMAEARERFGDVAAGIAAAFEAINNGLSPAFRRLARALDPGTYWTPDGPPPAPVVNAHTALIALNWAEWTVVNRRPDKRARRHAKAQYLKIRRHLPREYHRRLKSVPINQFGALT